MANYHELDSLKQQSLFPQSSGGRKSETGCHSGRACSETSGRATSLPLPVSGGSRRCLARGSITPASFCLHVAFPPHASLCQAALCLSLIRTPIIGFRVGFHLTDWQVLSRVRLCNPVDCSPPGPGKKYWSGLPFPSSGDLPNPAMKPQSLVSATVAARFFTTSATWGFFWRFLITFAKMLYPNKITFTGSRVRIWTHLWGPLFNPLRHPRQGPVCLLLVSTLP